MSRTLPQAQPAAGDHVRETSRRNRAWFNLFGWPAVIAAATLLFRLPASATAYDVYVDEFLYAVLGQTVREGNMPPGTPAEPFLIHPPGYFILETIWLTIQRATFEPFNTVFALRIWQQSLSAISAVMLFMIVRRLSGRNWPAVLAAGMFVVDPFILRQNGRILLETAVMTWALLGTYLLMDVVDLYAPTRIFRHRRELSRDAVVNRYATIEVAVAGLCLGMAVFTKDMAAIVSVVPLLWITALGRLMPRRMGLIALLACTVPYLIYLVFVARAGLLAEFFTNKFSGFSRLIGAEVTTGYNAEGAPTLGSVAVTQITQFGTSYLSMAIGGLCALWLFFRPPNRQVQVVALMGCLGCAMVLYGVLFGTSEEHLFYYPAVAVLPCIALVAAQLFDGGRRARLRRVAVAALVLAVLANLAVWVHVRTTRDQAQYLATRWMESNVPRGAKVVWFAGQTKYLLEHDGYQAMSLEAPRDMANEGTFYLYILQKEIDQRYSYASPKDVEYYTDRATRVFLEQSPSYGSVSIWKVNDAATWGNVP